MSAETIESLESPASRPGRPWWILPALLLALSVIALLAYGLIVVDRGQVSEGPAPDFALQTFEGDRLQLSELRGRPVVLNFWASWCLECDKEMVLLEETHQRYAGQIAFVGVDYLDTDSKARAYLDRFAITYPNVPDLGGQVSNDYRIRGVPETFFIDADGQIQGVHIGPLDQAALEGWIAKLQE